MDRDEDVLPDAAEELTMEHPIDDMDAEQTWPTEEELQGAKQRVRVPKGAGEYQASWYHTIDDDEHDDDPDEEVYMHAADASAPPAAPAPSP